MERRRGTLHTLETGSRRGTDAGVVFSFFFGKRRHAIQAVPFEQVLGIRVWVFLESSGGLDFLPLRLLLCNLAPEFVVLVHKSQPKLFRALTSKRKTQASFLEGPESFLACVLLLTESLKASMALSLEAGAAAGGSAKGSSTRGPQR